MFCYVMLEGFPPLDTGRKLNVHKTPRTSSERLMYVQFTSYAQEVHSIILKGCITELRSTRIVLSLLETST